MKSYKDPSFQDRVGRAAEAKKKALDRLRSKPPLDEKIVAERRAARLKREAAELERRTARKASEQAAREAKAAEAAAKTAAVPQPPSEAQRKTERDARYAARKNRK
jgi:hypothetical protein